MSLEYDWIRQTENGFTIYRNEETPLVDLSSLQFLSNADQYLMTNMRKSAHVYLRDPDARGIQWGKIRTRITRKSSDQDEGWSGVFLRANALGIGTFSSPTDSMYQVTDKGGSLRILKFTDGLPTVVHTYVENLPLDTQRSLLVSWILDLNTELFTIDVQLGSLADFSDLVSLGLYDTDDIPIALSMSEGLFAQTLTHTSACNYFYDTTRVVRTFIN